jgi:hypothetical protein
MGVALSGSAEGGGGWAILGAFTLHYSAMSEEQLKAAETEATAQGEEGVEEISEEDLEGVAGGLAVNPVRPVTPSVPINIG